MKFYHNSYHFLILLFIIGTSYANMENIIHNNIDLKYLNIISKLIDVKKNNFLNEKHISKISSKCISDVQDFFSDFLKLKPWAIAMMDSNTKIPESFMNMMFNNAGDMEECFLVNKLSNNKYRGQHCVMRFSMKSLLDLIQFPLNDDIKDYSEMIWSNYGICLPASCSVQDIRKFINWHLYHSNTTAKVFVDENYCNTSIHLPWRLKDTLGILFFVIFAFLVISSTYYDILTKGKYRENLYISFSWYSNGQRMLYGSEIEASPRAYDCLHGIRVLCILWIMIGHRIMSVIQYPVWNQVSSIFKFERNIWNMILCTTPLGVEVFFFMSGFLLGKIFFPIYASYKKLPYFFYVLNRYIRTTPSLIAVMIFEMTFSYHFAMGPFWRGEYLYKEKSCGSYWWANILYVMNYVETEDMCLLHSWYLGVDFQLFLLAPIILIPLMKNSNLGELWLNFLLILGIFISFYINYIYEIPVGLFDVDSSKFDAVNRSEYFPFYTRYVPYLMGIYLSWYFYKNRDKKFKLNKVQLWTYWILWSIFFIGCLLSIHPFLQIDYKNNLIISSVYVAFVRPIFIATICWLVFACSSGYGGFLNSFLSCKFFKMLSRLTYGIYLTHVFIQSVSQNSIWGPSYLSPKSMVFSVTGDLIGSFVLSGILFMTFEISFNKIKQIYIQRALDNKKPFDPEDGLKGKGSAQL